jgi:Protein of unknown function (DUF3761)
MRLLIITALLALGLGTSVAQAQRAPDPAMAQKLRELACREQAARDMQKPAQTPPGATRAWEFERVQREKLCLMQKAEADEAQLLSHRHYKAKDGHEVHSPAKSTHDQVPAGASAKCRDGTYSFSQHRRGTCSHHGGVGSWL